MTRAVPLLALLACAGALAGCAHHAGCANGARRAVHDSLHFGTAQPGGVVTPAEWADFLATSVTPRFPQGLTVTQAAGQWRGQDGAIVREDAYALLLVHPGEPAQEEAVRQIVAEYKTRFRQEAVLRVRSTACVSY